MQSVIRAQLRVLSIATGIVLALVVAAALVALDPGRANAADSTSVRSCTGGTVSLQPGERRLLYLINRARTRRDIPRLCVHGKLERAARSHSTEMMHKDYFSHFSSDGKEDPGERLERFGYDWLSYGENIDWGQGKLTEPHYAFDHWMHKREHRRLVLSRRLHEVGIGAAYGTFAPDSDHVYRDSVLWTVDFGTRR